MANQLSIPFKNTSPIDIRDAVKKFIISNHPETHPDAFRRDIDRWDKIRKDATLDNVHASKVHALQRYHSHLKFLLTKLPTDIGLDIPYSSAFNPSSSWIIIPNIAYERAAVLFNLAALHSQLAFSEDRTHPEGIKRALSHYQNAAGTLSYLVSSALPLLTESMDRFTHVYELSEPIISSLESLMLAQAQECAWQRAVLDRFNDALVAKLAARVSSYYRTAFKCIQGAPTPIRDAFPLEWIVHIDIKVNHFAAAAQYRRSMEDLSKNKYGLELSRLKEAQMLANRNSELARKANVAKSVFGDVKSLCDILQTNIARAERDNDLIYHQDIPIFSTLPLIQEISLVKPVISEELMDPRKAVKEDVLFVDLLPWGARNAISIYNDRRQTWLSEEIFGPAQYLDQIADSALQEMRLPASLEALDRPIGLPPSLLKKAEEVRVINGPERIEHALDNLETLAQNNRAALDQASAMDILDQEAEEDEAMRSASSQNVQWNSRPRSFEANSELTADERRYRTLLDQAAEGDSHLRDKWIEWEEAITRLTWDEELLEEWVPSSTVPSTKNKNLQTVGTQAHARRLRSLLEVLDDILRTRAALVNRVRLVVESDDVRPNITREATNVSLWTEVEAASFEPTLGKELMKYEKFKSSLDDNRAKQAEVLSSIKVENELFINSRREDKAVLEREHALQSLDLAYHKYRDIIQDLEEGYSFYNHMAGVISNFKERCVQWVRGRREEISVALSLNMEGLRIDEHLNDRTPRLSPAQLHSVPDDLGSDMTTRNVRSPDPFVLPPPDSEEWETTPNISQGSHTILAAREGHQVTGKGKGKKRSHGI